LLAAKEYGDIFSLKVMDQTMIVLNSPTAIRDVIDKHGAASSNRPKSILADMITPNNLNLGTGRYGLSSDYQSQTS
jgi:cytochrome P450